MRELVYQAIILKKQEYKEADEIITLFTSERGKLRILAKSSKLARSKLSYGLQPIFLSEIALVGRSLPKVIGVDPINSFPRIRENLESVKRALYALELTLKFTPDEEQNLPLFQLLTEYLELLNRFSEKFLLCDIALAKFKISFLETIGIAIRDEGNDISGFSNFLGGFVSSKTAADYNPLSIETLRQFRRLKVLGFQELAGATGVPHFSETELSNLQNLLSQFLTYHLERNIESEILLHY